MIGFNFDNIFIDFSETSFFCPHCKAKHEDINDFFLDRINKNKKGYTKIRCDKCNLLFNLTFDITGAFVTY
jgi:hypothetical protein